GNADFSNAIDVTGNVNATGNLDLTDSGRLMLGTGDDLQIYHTGSASKIDVYTTGLEIATDGTETLAKFNRHGSVELWHDGTKRFETSSVGVSIPQDLDVDGHTNLDNVSISGIATVGILTATTLRGLNTKVFNVLEVVGPAWLDGGAEFGTRTYNKGYASIDTLGIATFSGVSVSGVSTFFDIDVDGHTNLDNVS
ncbi:MAG: hypothetical protein VXY93_19460, partial [Pseudomonadota bacterium]|nr:hypothetical protein [Pseudomonadota bacterium]